MVSSPVWPHWGVQNAERKPNSMEILWNTSGVTFVFVIKCRVGTLRWDRRCKNTDRRGQTVSFHAQAPLPVDCFFLVILVQEPLDPPLEDIMEFLEVLELSISVDPFSCELQFCRIHLQIPFHVSSLGTTGRPTPSEPLLSPSHPSPRSDKREGQA